ncbi:hypothetical protein BVX98_00765 [bacterium F11]|nr:hypothetical protein BVX98_00765 [bacterium F11]
MIMEEKKVVALLTDFGLRDNYVGAMKGVLLSKVSDFHLVDITHEVPPQNIRYAAYQLMTCYQNFPKGTLFLCVVDPGVGTSRPILLVEANQRIFIAPDNGLLSWVLHEIKPTRVLDISKNYLQTNISHTFHGRDIMAPVAARVLMGENLNLLGEPVSSYVDIPFPSVQKLGSKWIGEVIAVDGFGNAISNVKTKDVIPYAENAKVWIEFDKKIPAIRGLVTSYESVEIGKLMAIGGSAGFVELSVREGSAAQQTGFKEGDKIVFQFRT